MVNIQKTLDGYVDLGLQLVHWWSYDTCRKDTFNDDSSWNMNMTDFPESVALIKAGNEALKAKWLVNRADADVIVTDKGEGTPNSGTGTDMLPTETAPSVEPDTTDNATTTAPEEYTAEGKGCGASLCGSAGAAAAAMGWALLRKRKEHEV